MDNELIMSFIKPEMTVIIPVLYIMGVVIKKSPVKDWKIPIILGITGIVLSAIYVGSTSEIDSFSAAMTGLFTAITQGILLAGCSVYVNNLIKQIGEERKKDEKM